MYFCPPACPRGTTTQVDGGAAGALIIEGTIAGTQGLPERVLVIRQQFNIPIRGCRTTSTHQFQRQAIYPFAPSPIIQRSERAARILARGQCFYQAFLSLQIQFGTTPQPLKVLALDGIPLQPPFTETTIPISAGRTSRNLSMPALPNGQSATFLTTGFNTGPVGNRITTTLANIVDLGFEAANSCNHPVKAPSEPATLRGLLAAQ